MPVSTQPRSSRAEWFRSTLWVWAAGSAVIGVAAALLLLEVRPRPASVLARIAWPGDAASAVSLVQTVAAAAITVTTLTFSLTVITLQLASQQFSPRLLREFTRDPIIKGVLAVLAGTFAFSLTTLRGLDANAASLPVLAVGCAGLLGLASLAAVLSFITHIVRVLRVDTMMLVVHDETADVISTFYPERGEPRRHPAELELDTRLGTVVRSSSGGYVRRIDVDKLLREASEEDVLVRIDVRAGDHLVRDMPMATVWDGRGRRVADASSVADGVRDAVALGYERTSEQDAAFGFRQLTDIAVKALSPGINDPTTADAAVGHMADLLIVLAGRQLGPTLHEDGQGAGRVVVLDRDLRYYLDLACGQVRRYGAREPTVLMSLLRLLRNVASVYQEEGERAEVRRQVRLILQTLDGSLPEEDRRAVEDLAGRVETALGGEVVGALDDRAGETRSL